MGCWDVSGSAVVVVVVVRGDVEDKEGLEPTSARRALTH